MSSPSYPVLKSEEPAGSDQYKQIAKEYKKSKMLPFRTESETPTIMGLIGKDLGEKNVCDLACGEGFYTRQYRDLTTGTVVGVDISENMINLANDQEDPNSPQKIQYRCADACKSEFLEEFGASFDVATATFLLNYATSKEMMDMFIESAFRLLKPGGKFIGINTSPFVTDQATFNKTHKYSVAYTTDESPIKEGDPLHIHLKMESGDAKFDNYFWTAETYEASFAKYGFQEVKWVNMGLKEGNDKEHWQDWLENSPLICFSTMKPSGDA